MLKRQVNHDDTSDFLAMQDEEDMSPIPILDVNACRELGVHPLPLRQDVMGQDFCYDWNKVQAAAGSLGQNLDSFLSFPIGDRLTHKGLKTPVTFWYTPLGHIFVVTVCSKRKTDFMDPLHSMPGYLEYGENYSACRNAPHFWMFGVS